MCCHPFHVSFVCMGKVWQAWNIINANRLTPIQAIEQTSCRTRFGENCKTTMPSPNWRILLNEECQTMCVLSPIPHILWVHGLGLKRLGTSNRNTGVLFIQASEHLRYGTKFGENCRTTMPSLGWCMMLHEEPHVMDMLSPVRNVVWVHGQGLTSLGHNAYIRILRPKPQNNLGN